MDTNTFVAEFAHIANAPNGVQRLREMILDLAVRGKLVPQDASDEPALVLLERIAAEKARLVKEKLAPKFGNNRTKGFPKQIDFELPPSWTWTNLENVATYIQRGRSPKYVEKSTVPIVSQKCVQWSGFSLAKARFLDLAILDKYENKRFLRKGDLLWNSTGLGTVGRCILFEPQAEYPKIVADSHVTIVRPCLIDSRYLFSFIASHHIQSIIEDITTGTTKQSELGTGVVRLCPFPLPPLAEQKRIVAKVDELMALCDKLEEAQQAQATTQAALTKSALHQLMNAESDHDLHEAWKLVGEHFATITDEPSAVQALRDAILQLAVRGKLVPQDESDEPASVLLERIATEKARLVKEKKIKKQKPLPPITDEDKPFEIPKGWEYCFISSMVKSEQYSIKRGPFGSAIKKSYFVPSGYKVYEQKNAIYDDFSLGHYYVDEKKFEELRAFEVKPHDIIVSCSGTVGKLAIAPEWMEVGLINQALLKLSMNQNVIINEFFVILFEAYVMQTNLLSELKGTAQKNIVSVKELKTLLMPLPPLAEQKRIVAKVDELMALCDKLEASLTARKNTATLLAQSATKTIVEDLAMLDGKSKDDGLEDNPLVSEESSSEQTVLDNGQLTLF